MLAAFVDDPARVTVAQMERWCRDFDNWAICDTICFHLFDHTPHAWTKVSAWAGRREEFVKRAAFALLASLSVHDKQRPRRALRPRPEADRTRRQRRPQLRQEGGQLGAAHDRQAQPRAPRRGGGRVAPPRGLRRTRPRAGSARTPCASSPPAPPCSGGSPSSKPAEGRAQPSAAACKPRMSSFTIFSIACMTRFAFLLILVAQQLAQDRRDDLPRHPEPVDEPAALNLLAAGGQLLPVAVDLLLRLAADEQRRCLPRR